MSVKYKAIRKVFETRLAAMFEVPVVAWENVAFEPDPKEPYISVRFVPVIRQPANRGRNPKQYYRGYFLIQVYVPEGSGPFLADDIVEKIIKEFESTTDISDGTTTVPLEYAEAGLGVLEGAFYTIPVRIGWYFYSI